MSVAYLALVREVSVSGEARWRDWYQFFPWEDWRDGHPAVLDQSIAPALDHWAATAPDPRSRQERRERAEIVFGLGGVAWDGERVLERYELLYEAGLVPEARRDSIERGEAGRLPPEGAVLLPARAMALDHRRILATALGRLRGKLKYRPVVFELLRHRPQDARRPGRHVRARPGRRDLLRWIRRAGGAGCGRCDGLRRCRSGARSPHR